jgi:hypothetical protein
MPFAARERAPLSDAVAEQRKAGRAATGLLQSLKVPQSRLIATSVIRVSQFASADLVLLQRPSPPVMNCW